MSKPTGSQIFYGLILSWLLGWFSGGFRALVFMKGWEWFVVDTFDAPSLGFVQAWGLALVTSLVTLHLQGDNGEDPLTPSQRALATMFGSLLLSSVFFLSLFILSWYV